MSSVNNNTSIYESAGLATSSSATTQKAGGKDEFLQLMIAQMKNQDPMKPMESGEFLSQLAQFESATGIRELKDSFTGLSDTLQSNQALQASGMVGRTVLVPSNVASLTTAGLHSMIDLTERVDELKVSVYDSSGQLVSSAAMGPQSKGMLRFDWDGRSKEGQMLPPGNYVVKAESLMGGVSTAASTYSLARVESVSLGQGGRGVTLNLAGGGSSTLSDVKQVM